MAFGQKRIQDFYSVIQMKFAVVGFEVLTAVVMNVAISWDIAPCSPYVNRRTYIHTSIHIHITYIHTLIHTYIITYIRTYIHTHRRRCKLTSLSEQERCVNTRFAAVKAACYLFMQ
jgi:hypothetical protein